METLLAEIQTERGKDIAEVYRTPNKDHEYEIRTPPETDPIDGTMKERKESIRSNTQEFLKSIDHPDSDSDLHVNMV